MTRTNSEPRNIRRVLDKDVMPAIGDKAVADVTIPDILAITDAVKARGADQMALQTRNVIKRLFAYGKARGKIRFNPAAAIEARFIATSRSRSKRSASCCAASTSPRSAGSTSWRCTS